MVPPCGWSYDVMASSQTLSMLILYALAEECVHTPQKTYARLKPNARLSSRLAWQDQSHISRLPRFRREPHT